MESENDNHFEFVKKNSVEDNHYDEKQNGYSHHFNDFDQNDDHFTTNGNLNLMQSESKTIIDNDLMNSSKFEDIYSAPTESTNGKLAINNENYLDDGDDDMEEPVKELANNLIEPVQHKLSDATSDSGFAKDEDMFQDEKYSALETECMTNEEHDLHTEFEQKNDDISDSPSNTNLLDQRQDAFEAPVETETLIPAVEKYQAAEEYNYKLSEDDGCMDPMTTSVIIDNKSADNHYINDAAASSSDEEDLEEKKDEEKSYTSTESEEASEQPYEKLQEEKCVENVVESSVDLVDNASNNFVEEAASSNNVHFDLVCEI